MILYGSIEERQSDNRKARGRAEGRPSSSTHLHPILVG
jgi:hypothetical protein